MPGFGGMPAGFGCGFLGHRTLLDQRQWGPGWHSGSQLALGEAS